MATAAPITASEILGDIFQPIDASFAPDFAKMLLSLRLGETAQEEIRELLRNNNAGALGQADQVALENYLLVGQFLDLLQAKARVSLQKNERSA